MSRSVKVWDVPTRLFHWLLVGLVGAMWYTGQQGVLELHIRCGVLLLALLVFRLIWGVVGSQTARFSDFLRGPAAIRRYLAGDVSHAGHNPMGGWMVLVMLTVLLTQVGTGLFASDVDSMLYDGPLAHLAGGAAETMTAVHKLGVNILLLLVALHLAAIVFYRVVKKEALVPAMVTGRKALPYGVTPPFFAPVWRAALCLAAAAGLVAAILRFA
ncbi:cytochrome b/b6 domain-containing protein [Paludibacterium paludis]|uniref:Nickel-dependent hydrogenase b-type cytochrome subunit n=1 Tax=Paludibacterium paludis TaxID=1225769 RepID=A0A918P4E5_9NEIS|nr:cytochrome b/b6 domain-containing protein [Paludibacterium paludis]GGY19352.1 nickel-dependent hydrogenase b-type cytochrome subunit [Paludibacterium paludis]